MGKIANNADFWAGVMFILFGAAAVYMSRDYPMGSAMRMGPGYFPTYLGYLMMAFGLYIGGKGLLKGSGDEMGRWAFRPIVVLSLGVVVFGFLIEKIGFVPSLVALIVITSLAGKEFRPIELVIVTIGLVIGAVAVFIWGIGLPYQLFWWY